MKMEPWKHNQRLKIERTLNFSTIPRDEDEFSYSRRKTARDPMSHRIIEKRRRDRMNNCLADLSRLIPHQYMKKGRGRIEKTEIIEMTIKHLKHLQAHSCKDPASCEVAKVSEQDSQHQYRLGFQECMSEAVRFLVEAEGLFPAEGTCFRLLAHLQEHYDKLTRGSYINGRVSTTPLQEARGRMPMEVDPNIVPCGYSIDVYPLKRSSSPSYEVLPQQHQPAASEQPLDDCSHTLPTTDISQLREMLQNPNVPMERMRSNSTSSTASSYTSRPCISVYDRYSNPKITNCSEEVYKFKTNIKERFNADLHHHVEEIPAKFSMAVETFPSPSMQKTQKVHNTVNLESPERTNMNHNELKIGESELVCLNSQTDPQTDSSNGSSSPMSNGRSNGSSSGYSTSGDSPPKTKPQSRSQSPEYVSRDTFSARGRPDDPDMVPIFALHPKGHFYIPMSVEAGIVGPYLSSIEDAIPVLHPVSISVNFCRPISFAGSEQVAWQPQQKQHQQTVLCE